MLWFLDKIFLAGALTAALLGTANITQKTIEQQRQAAQATEAAEAGGHLILAASAALTAGDIAADPNLQAAIEAAGKWHGTGGYDSPWANLCRNDNPMWQDPRWEIFTKISKPVMATACLVPMAIADPEKAAGALCNYPCFDEGRTLGGQRAVVAEATALALTVAGKSALATKFTAAFAKRCGEKK